MTDDDYVYSDNPLTKLEQDRLGRVALADRIVAHIDRWPLESSLRISIEGSWGNGKTSFVNWLLDIFKEKHGPVRVVNLAPWQAESVEGFWQQLLDKLDPESPKAALGNLKGVVKPLSELSSYSRAIYNVAEYLAKPTRTDVAEAIGSDQRIFIVIDDLDRADAKLIPTILLGMRELLDLPNTVFLLPYDHQIVSSAIRHHHPAWGEGGELFLEKIINLRVRLREPNKNERGILLKETLKVIAKDIPQVEVDKVAKYLPSTPRRIKQIARQLSPTNADLTGDKTKIHWLTLLLSTIVRLQNEIVYREITDRFMRDAKEFKALQQKSDVEVDKLIKDVLTIGELREGGLARTRMYDLLKEWLDSAKKSDFSRVSLAIRLREAPDVQNNV